MKRVFGSEAKELLTSVSSAAAAWVVILAMFATLRIVSAQESASLNLPTAAEVLQRYVDATGGRDALLRHKSITVHGRYQDPANHLDVETVGYSKGMKAMQKAFLPGGKLYQAGYDGKVAWDIDLAGKVTIHQGDDAKSIARDADMYYHLHVLDYFKSMDVVGIQEFDGHQCYALKGVNNWNQPNEQFYDKKSGLLIGYLFDSKSRGGAGETTQFFEDYRDFGGVLLPTKSTGRDASGVSTSLVTSVTYDDLDDSVFVLPDAVKKTLAQERESK